MGSKSSAVTSDYESDPAPTVRVLLDARKLGDGGIGVYIENTIEGLLAEPGITLTLIGKPDVISRYGFSNRVAILPNLSSPHSLNEILTLSSRIHWNEFDLYHSPHFIIPRGIPIPTVVTIHDIIHVVSPERFYYPWIASPLIRASINKASKIITVSETSKSELMDVFGDDLGDRISVIPNSLRRSLAELAKTPEAHTPPKIKLPSNYLLTVASNQKPHKGLRDLLDAFSVARSTIGEEIGLVIVGMGTKKSGKDSSNVIQLGEVDDNTLAYLYNNALALVVPSKIEGFCIPVIEAHAFGTPVVCRPVPAVLELLGKEDEVASSFSVPSLAHAIESMILHPRRVTASLPARYDLTTASTMTSDVYRSSISGRSNFSAVENK